MKILDLMPINFIPELQKWQDLDLPSDEEKTQVMERASQVGYVVESSIVAVVHGGSPIILPPGTYHIRLNDPTGQGYHRDYRAQIDET
jgi:hypothetical protein